MDGSASGEPVGLRVARSSNGDGFVVWRAYDGTQHDLWASRNRIVTGTWSEPVRIEAGSADVSDDFHLHVDAAANAMVVWAAADAGVASQVVSARFDAGTGSWSAPVPLGGKDANEALQVAGDASGAVHVAYNTGGRAFDPASGTWLPLAPIALASLDQGFLYGTVPALDGNGNALALFRHARTGAELLGSNYYTRSTGRWEELPPDSFDVILGMLPLSGHSSRITEVEMAVASQGNFLAAWQSDQDEGAPSDIRVAHYTSLTRTWSQPQKLVVGGGPARELRLQRLGADASGNGLLLWTDSGGSRTVLKALRLDEAGLPCDAALTIDTAVGGGAAHVDLAVDRQGDAIAIWQQSEGGRADDGTRSNIAISRFDGRTAAWGPATFAESQPGNALGPRISASGGHALLGWIQSQGGANRVHVTLLSF